jgi:hypothetical protein
MLRVSHTSAIHACVPCLCYNFLTKSPRCGGMLVPMNTLARRHAAQVSHESYTALHPVVSRFLGVSLPVPDNPQLSRRWGPVISRVAGWGRNVLLALPLSILGTAALAVDAKTFPGAMCQPTTNTDPIVRDSNGKMFNTGPVSQTWICPVVRDTMAAKSLQYVSIHVVGSARCDFRSRGMSTGVILNVSADQIINKPGNIKQLLFSFSSSSNIKTQYTWYYFFQCMVGQGSNSGIIDYYIQEDS